MPMTELAARYLSEWSREWQGTLGGARSGKPEVQQKKNQYSTLGMFGLMTRVNFCQDISLHRRRTCLSLNVFHPGPTRRLALSTLKPVCSKSISISTGPKAPR